MTLTFKVCNDDLETRLSFLLAERLCTFGLNVGEPDSCLCELLESKLSFKLDLHPHGMTGHDGEVPLPNLTVIGHTRPVVFNAIPTTFGSSKDPRDTATLKP